MQLRRLGALFVAVLIVLTASAQSQNSDTLQTLKNSLTPDQQSSILQDVLGKGGASGKKTEPKLDTPENVRRKNGPESDAFEKLKNEKTLDGRILRQLDENPADDTVLIELVPNDEFCIKLGGPDDPNNPNNSKANPNGGVALNVPAGALNNGVGGVNPNGTAGLTENLPYGGFSNIRCKPTETPKTDQDKQKTEKFRKRVMDNNPYKLNSFGACRRCLWPD